MGDQIDAKGGGDACGDDVDARGGERRGAQPEEVPVITVSDQVSDRYNMNYPKLGKALIINNRTFEPRTGMGERTGTDADAQAMYEVLSSMNFSVVVKHDLSTEKMEYILHTLAQEDHSNEACFFCVILSHGEEGYVFGTNDKIEIQRLVEPFKGHNCKTLAGKPKIFLIQACRGTALDAGVTVSDAHGDMDIDQPVEVRRIPTEADFLIAYSVVPGYFAWRNSSRGSWFIQAVVEVFRRHWDTMDLLTMMTRVNKRVAYDFTSNASKEFMNRKKQIPCITSMLTRDCFFKPK